MYERCSVSLVIREIEMETILKYHKSSTRMTKVKFSEIGKYWQGYRIKKQK